LSASYPYIWYSSCLTSLVISLESSCVSRLFMHACFCFSCILFSFLDWIPWPKHSFAWTRNTT
jgi:hypothetical protein